jgi:hypothetical protein
MSREWLDQFGPIIHGRTIILNGIERVVRFSAYEAIYPYRHTVRNLHAEPTAKGKRTEAYQSEKHILGDDWFTDLAESDPTVLADVAARLGLTDQLAEAFGVTL